MTGAMWGGIFALGQSYTACYLFGGYSPPSTPAYKKVAVPLVIFPAIGGENAGGVGFSWG
jgi:hypothetical protein